MSGMFSWSWFKRRREDIDKQSSVMPTYSADQSLLNQGVYNTVDDLIALQRHVRQLDLSKRSPALASTAGNHHSRFRGRGMDYQESRIYQPGDDIRNMDWRVTARAGKPHTKLYQEERERPVVLLVDFSPSMFFGSVKALKSVVATQVAALLGWATAKKGDRVGALLVNGEHKEIPPKMGKRGALNLIRELVIFSNPEKGLASRVDSHHLNEELQRLRRIARPGSLVFLISDFYSINEETQRHLLRLRQHNDLVAIQVVDPLELSAPPAGKYSVTNGEQDGILDTRSSQGKSQYNVFFSQHHERVKSMMRKNKIPLLIISTIDDVPTRLQSYFSVAKRSAITEKQVT